MKKSEWMATVAQTVKEWHQKKPLLKEYDPMVPDSPENQENPAHYDPQLEPKPQPATGVSKFNHIDWLLLWEALLTNEDVVNKQSNAIGANVGDLTDEEGMLSREDLQVLIDADIVYIEGSFPVLLDPKYKDFSLFKADAQKAWEAPPKTQSNSNWSEAPWLRGNEPMSEQLDQIYEQFKNILKEDVDKVNFNTKLRGVFYEYAQGVSNVTPTTQDPVRDPENTPENIIKTGQQRSEEGKAIEDVGKKLDDIEKRHSNPATGTSNVAIKEYVEEEILPTVVEIMKQNERPRTTKKALMEMFHSTKKS